MGETFLAWFQKDLRSFLIALSALARQLIGGRAVCGTRVIRYDIAEIRIYDRICLSLRSKN
jgi:hypothetical protein